MRDGRWGENDRGEAHAWLNDKVDMCQELHMPQSKEHIFELEASATFVSLRSDKRPPLQFFLLFLSRKESSSHSQIRGIRYE